MGIKGFERRLERAVEGTFSRLFRSGLSPVEFGRKLEREMDAHRTVGVDGRTIAPNSFTFSIAPVDGEQLADLLGTLRRELADAAREHARDEGYAFVGPVAVQIEVAEGTRPGVLAVTGRFAEGDGGLPRARCSCRPGTVSPSVSTRSRSGARTTARSCSRIPT